MRRNLVFFFSKFIDIKELKWVKWDFKKNILRNPLNTCLLGNAQLDRYVYSCGFRTNKGVKQTR